ncbi:uncharacterized protein LOC130071699 [Rhinichthys klamathensis goyatoka]|uniref:uncharacterized protein LOC130071699 n=1 Tax=Rhinichthys klamathensis goyatoka TaxID=3034132 RepID=UPI0024B4E2F4|nr:uncharacterized protein LOC130071699 [Rhinichthys klamathensis goyatoka]
MEFIKEESKTMKTEEAFRVKHEDVKIEETFRVKHEDVKIEEAFRVKHEDVKIEETFRVKHEDVKIEEAFRVKCEETEERTGKGTITTTINRRTFVIPQGLQVCFLTDSMCRDIEDHFPNAQCWVHPDTTLLRSVQQHIKHFEKLHNYTIVILHIGTNDIASGASASTVVQRMKTLIARISLVNPHVLYFAISAILPRANDDSTLKTTIKQCNSLIQHWTSQTRNILFLNTSKPFLKNGKIIQDLYKDDGLHLNQEGKHKLFSYFQRFLWHFCQFPPRPKRT